MRLLYCIYKTLAIYCIQTQNTSYQVATISTIDKIIGLFCRMSSLLQVSSAKDTYNLIDPTNCSHPIGMHADVYIMLILYINVRYILCTSCTYNIYV